ncbi:MAG: hypothetical protein EBR42_09730 [Betaproteobacteria bacterium]|nr:hypothetical protein [Betaproteobacteria bacterium]
MVLQTRALIGLFLILKILIRFTLLGFIPHQSVSYLRKMVISTMRLDGLRMLYMWNFASNVST